MTARPFGEIVADLVARTHRLALIGELLETFPDKSDQKEMVMLLYGAGVLTDQSTELLIENYGLHSA